MSVPGQPPQRIGDAERDRAADQLREHLALGRLDQAEFDDRLDAAMRARYASDLDSLFGDLPPADRSPAVPTDARLPAKDGAPAHRPRGLSRRTEIAIDSGSWVIWPIVIGLITLLGWGDFWWLVFVPIALTSAWQTWKHTDDKDNTGDDRRRLGGTGSDD